ncbi:hypothetical protein RJ40_11830 [Methanofollis aquaemaris]|uniref:Uncharacterized protein n=1 Tax=Methanofollis aquaemaris TaxID=126734 RepID=A0A8A3S7M2_9EURY|nr:hypothetical protein [Methanofollis aquaemaris]QSZ68135.1 hypothetical protein RJ40_11830 [Methanofollis aquaemaris]
MTKNEAAALETVATMGWDQFTIKMLQEALGLSYHQVYRILHGYASRGSTYSGLLEKCPAISYLDTTVTEDMDGCAVRRREHLFLFDRGGYLRWARGAAVGIAGGDDDEGHDQDRDDDPGPGTNGVCNFAAGLQQIYSRCREDQSARDSVRSDSTSTDRETRLSICTKLQQNPHPPTPPGSSVSGSVGGCDVRNVANDRSISSRDGDKPDRQEARPPLSCSAFRKLLQTAVKKGDLLQETLPGVLDHREFTRVSTDLGRCDVCAEGKAVHRSADG